MGDEIAPSLPVLVVLVRRHDARIDGVDLCVNTLPTLLHRPRREIERGRELFVALTFEREKEHALLAGRQAETRTCSFAAKNGCDRACAARFGAMRREV